MLTLVLLMGLTFTIYADDEENPGDIVTNPWGELFTETQTNTPDLPIESGTTQPGTETTQASGGETESVVTTTDAGQVVEVTNTSDSESLVKPGKVKIKKAKKVSAKKIKITLKKVKNIKGYQVAVYKNKKQAKKNKKALYKKYIKKNKAKFTISSKKLKGKKTLFVRVRAYKKPADKAIYGQWSKIKKVK